MTLEQIIKDSGVISVHGDTDIVITSVCSDSRKAVAGSLFIAVKGYASDGHSFIGNAVGQGAAAVVYEDGSAVQMEEGVTYIKVASSRHALAVMAANFYDSPSRKLTLVGITGTNGKTTTVTLLYRMFTGLG
ncbi:MAG: UDP-N-acetylmuramoyl-L-alanyl-D-glutamate--2,6-diaminopimelate ligase, partial [Bacteroidales bacterium]|nr:UDP-N-acetylmuramoyl-L-alanyl-D-glutamate--2,6-diaminopimelate ligase [Bacteroidales bacterium]